MFSKKIVLKFPPRQVDQPVVCNLVKRFDLEFNILKAYVTPKEEGLLVLEVMGEEAAFDQGMEYLADNGIKVQPLSQDIVRNETRCTHCGACVSVCATDALQIERESMLVVFENGKCIACELCVRACPVRAMEVHF